MYENDIKTNTIAYINAALHRFCIDQDKKDPIQKNAVHILHTAVCNYQNNQAYFDLHDTYGI